MTMQQLAGPFAARPAPGASGLMSPFSGQAGANSLMMPSTQALMPAMNNVVATMNRPAMARSSQMAAQSPQSGGSMSQPTDQDQGAPRGEKGSGGDAPDIGDITDNLVELLIGACAGGAFIGGFAAANAAAPAAATGVATPAAVTAVLSSMGAGCVLGAATASVSLGAVAGWRALGR